MDIDVGRQRKQIDRFGQNAFRWTSISGFWALKRASLGISHCAAILVKSGFSGCRSSFAGRDRVLPFRSGQRLLKSPPITPPGIGQDHCAVNPVKQQHAEALLQLLDLMADRRRGNKQLFSGGGKEESRAAASRPARL